MPVLTLYEGQKKLKSFRVKPDTPVTIGRLESNTIVLDNPAVSNFHAEIENEGKQFFITDYQSRNGTFVNKELVISRQLNHGDQIAINPYTLVFGFLQGEERGAPQSEVSQATMHIDTSDHRSRLAKSLSGMAEPEAQRDRFGCLSFLAGDHDPYVLTGALTRIGKAADCEVVVKGLMVGQTAAEITRTEANGYVLRFAGGPRKPRVNYQSVATEVPLNEFDIIEIGSTAMQFHYCKSKSGGGSHQTQEIPLDDLAAAPDNHSKK
jgi:pSer/pThr/pTyr-binding forkhead associated (FHA) protein